MEIFIAAMSGIAIPLLGICISVIMSLKKGMKEAITEFKKEVKESIDTFCKENTKAHDDLWERIYHHGHNGGGKVTIND